MQSTEDDKVQPTQQAEEEYTPRWQKIADIPQEERNTPGWWLFSKEGWEEHLQERERELERDAQRAERERRDREEEFQAMVLLSNYHTGFQSVERQP